MLARRIAANIAKLPGFFLSEHLELFLWLLLPGGMPHPERMRGNTPHIVELVVGRHGLDVGLGRWIMHFHSSRHIKPRHGRIIFGVGKVYYRWCFTDLPTARTFIEQFGGKALS